MIFEMERLLIRKLIFTDLKPFLFLKRVRCFLEFYFDNLIKTPKCTQQFQKF